jgi:hypothetical protein
MRHYFALGAARAISGLAGGVTKATRAAALILAAGRAECGAARQAGTIARTVALTAIADAAEEDAADMPVGHT